MIANLTGTHADWVVAVARIVLGIIFFAHGAQQLLGWYGGPGLASSMRTFTEHLHVPPTLAFLVIAGELFSGVGLIVGLFSRIAALVIALTMMGAIATVHFRFGLFLNWFGTQEGHGIEYHLLTITGLGNSRPGRGNILLGSGFTRTHFGFGTVAGSDAKMTSWVTGVASVMVHIRITARGYFPEPFITERGRNNHFWPVPEAPGVLVEALISP